MPRGAPTPIYGFAVIRQLKRLSDEAFANTGRLSRCARRLPLQTKIPTRNIDVAELRPGGEPGFSMSMIEQMLFVLALRI
jgi:hypothetical protein